MRLGLTGSIATGKSTIATILLEKGAQLVDADRIARDIVQPGSPLLNEIALQFGEQVILPDGTLDRKALGQIIFENEARKKQLNELMHPAIRAEMKRQIAEYEAMNPNGLIVVDVPLLYESNLVEWFDAVMLAYVPQRIQIQRLMARDGISEENAKKRVFSQIDIEQKKQRADIVINNSNTVDETRQQIDTYWKQKGFGSSS